MYALNIDKETGRILSATFPEYAPADAVIVDELPDGDISNYLYAEGEYIYDLLPEPEEPETPESSYITWDDLAKALSEGVNSI